MATGPPNKQGKCFTCKEETIVDPFRQRSCLRYCGEHRWQLSQGNIPSRAIQAHRAQYGQSMSEFCSLGT